MRTAHATAFSAGGARWLLVVDVFLVAGNQGVNHSGSFLYRNDGGLNFSKIVTGDIADSLTNTGWGCAWADVDADGWTDLVIAAAAESADLVVLHYDHDFDLIADVTGQPTEWILEAGTVS